MEPWYHNKLIRVSGMHSEHAVDIYTRTVCNTNHTHNKALCKGIRFQMKEVRTMYI